MKALVTGGTGFTGSALSRRLAEAGHEVIALDTKPGLAGDELRRLGVRIENGSVADRTLVDQLVRGCDRVYHLAAAFRQVNLGRRAYHDVNVNGTRWICEAALRERVQRVVYCSTCGVHGNVANPPAREESPIAPADYYQQTKWEGELVAREFMERGLSVSIVRPTAIYGPGDPERFLMIFRRVANGRFIFLGDGAAHYHPVYVENLVDGILLAGELDAAQGQTYLIGDDQSMPIRDLVAKVATALDSDPTVLHLPFWPAYVAAAAVELAYKPLPFEPPIFRRRLDWFRQNRSFDISKARRELNYQPRVPLGEGLRLTAAWYRQQGLI
ncbi:MAG: NAD-dependent epimerase/dehydratase family protein [Gemmatimonadaceae bacterium]